MFALMKDLQHMGENNAAIRRRGYVSRETFSAASAIYRHLYGSKEDSSVIATYQIIYMIGWSPHASQQQPRARGSAQMNLGEVEGMRQLLLDPNIPNTLPISNEIIIRELDNEGNLRSNKNKESQ